MSACKRRKIAFIDLTEEETSKAKSKEENDSLAVLSTRIDLLTSIHNDMLLQIRQVMDEKKKLEYKQNGWSCFQSFPGDEKIEYPASMCYVVVVFFLYPFRRCINLQSSSIWGESKIKLTIGKAGACLARSNIFKEPIRFQGRWRTLQEIQREEKEECTVMQLQYTLLLSPKPWDVNRVRNKKNVESIPHLHIPTTSATKKLIYLVLAFNCQERVVTALAMGLEFAEGRQWYQGHLLADEFLI